MMRIILTLCLLGSVLSDPLKTKADIPGVKRVKYLIGPGNQICNLNDLAKAVGLPLHFSLEEANKFALGGDKAKARLLVKYDNVEVREFNLQATKNGGGCFVGLVTGYFPTIKTALDMSSSRSENELRSAMADYLNIVDPHPELGPIKTKDVDSFTAKRVIYIKPRTGAASLAYECKGVVELPDKFRFGRMVIGTDYKVIASESRVKFASSESSESSDEDQGSCPNLEGGNQKTGSINYGSGANEICLDVQRKGNKCTLKHDNFEVKTMENGVDPSKAKDVSFDCDVGPNDDINGARSPCLDAFNAARGTFDMLNDLEGIPRNERKRGHDQRMKIWCHFGQDFSNSFYDGKNVAMGDGSASVFPFPSSYEVVGHEIGHDVSAKSNCLQYTDQSLAIDEAFADITGRAAAAYNKQMADNDWKFGASLLKQDGGFLRDFQNPELDGVSIKHVNDYQLTQAPYQSMGVFTHAYYWIVVGCNFDHVAAYQPFLLAVRICFTNDMTFMEAAICVTRAAGDLGKNTSAFIEGFKKVGLDVTPYL